jgi:hypothetical protein
MISLPLQRYVLGFDASPRREAPAFAGNAWRSAFGRALRTAACRTGAAQCDGCPLRSKCDYGYLFETPPPVDAAQMRRYTNAPHPYVLRELASPRPGQVELMLTLIGKACAVQPLVLRSLAAAAAAERGIDGERMRLADVRRETSPGSDAWHSVLDVEDAPSQPAATSPPAPPEGAVRLRWLTPLRIKTEGRTLAPAEIGFGELFGTLMRRISMLCAFHAPAPLAAPFAELAARSRQVRMRGELGALRQQRFSSRQGRAMPMDGVVGWLELDAADAREFWPFLWLGQFVHAGSAATMGLGCYEIVAAPASLPAATRAA